MLERHQEFEVAHADFVAVEKPPWIAFSKGIAVTVDKNTVRADICEIVSTGLKVDGCVLA